MRITRGQVLAMLAAICFGTLAVSGKYAFTSGMAVPAFMAWRFGASAVLFWIWLLASRRQVWIGWSAVLRLGFAGLLLALEASVFFLGVADPHISAGLAETTFFVYPAWAVLATSRSSAGRHHLWAALLAIVGVGLTAGSLSGASPAGVSYLLAASLLYAAYVVLSGKWLAGIDPWTGSTWMASSAAIALLLVQRLTQTPTANGVSGWLAVASAVTIGTFAAYALLYAALHRESAPTVAVLSTFEPVVAVVLGAILLGERMTLPQLIGSALVLSSVAYLLRAESRRLPEPELH